MVYHRIKDLREDNDIKQATIAKYLNCSQPSYSYYENGINEVPLQVLSKLADFYNTSTDYLLNRTDDPRPYPPKRKVP